MANYVIKGGFEEARCKLACPAGIDVPRYIRAIRLGQYDNALRVVREKIPFPAVCAYVCPRLCEMKCRRADVDEPVAINALKRFVVDKIQFKPDTKSTTSSGKKVAIVGSGPAGLTAAYYLFRICGHQVTVFEARAKIGGMLEGGIPPYRLPRDVLGKELDMIKGLGIEIKTGIKIDKPESLLEQGFNAVLVAVGAWKGIKIGIPGEENHGVLDGLDFLNKANSGNTINLGINVAVIGGGNVAVDAARTALRMGAKNVSIIYRRGSEEMPARKDEIEQALDEGVKIIALTMPTKILRMGKQLQVYVVRTSLGGIDNSGRRSFEVIQETQYALNFDNIIIAIGETPVLESDTKLARDKNGTIIVDPVTLATNIPGVYAAGDAVSGPATVIEAIAAGRKAAQSIDLYLNGNGIIDEVFSSPEKLKMESWDESILDISRRRMPEQDRLERINNFDVVEIGFTEDLARIESERCLRCDLNLPVTIDTRNCIHCYICQQVCSFTYQHSYNPEKARIIVGYWPKKIHFSGDCIGGCSLCAKYCTTEAITVGAKT